VRKLGDIGDKVTENELLLLEHDVPHLAFSATVQKDLPSMPWAITQEVSQCVKTARSSCSCTNILRYCFL
jgi:exosome complex exonuclease DIS3/RRP44